MVRVPRRPHSARQRPGKAVKKISQKHKVVMESVTQEKKKLRSIISFEAKAPPGYTFIPAGNPRLTTACKEASRKDGLRVYAVTTTPHMRNHNLSQHVHRIGYHFPSTVVAAACMDLGLYLTPTGKAVPFYNVGSDEGLKRNYSEASQITINTEARDILRDLFPNIPDSDLNQIIKTAFQKGQRKVGTAVELPLARRAQLAAVAHIRHVYTTYDRLLKATSFHEARKLVEDTTLARLVEWRGDDENGKTVLEDVFREVIVISDDEDDPDSEEDPPTVHRDQSVEVISSNPVHDELQTTPINYSQPSREPLRELSVDDAPPGFRVVPVGPRKDKIDRRGFSRYAAWDRAINRYRRMADENDSRKLNTWHTDYQQPLPAVLKPFPEDVSGGAEPMGLHTAAPRRGPAWPLTGFGPKSGSGHRIPSTNAAVERRVSFRETPAMGLNHAPFQAWTQEASDPILTPNEPYELHRPVDPTSQRNRHVSYLPEARVQHMRAPNLGKPWLGQGDAADPPVFVSSLSKNLEGSESQFGRRPGAPATDRDRAWLNPQDRALPSIEAPQSPALEAGRPNHERSNHLAEPMSDGISVHPVAPDRLPRGNIPYQSDEGHSKFPTLKRRRVSPDEPSRHDPLPISQYGARNPATFTAPRDLYTDDPFISKRYAPVERRPAQDDSHTRRKCAVPIDSPHSATRQMGMVQNQPSGPTAIYPGPRTFTGRPVGHPDTHPSHDQRRRYTHQREATGYHNSAGASYVAANGGTFGYPVPKHRSDPRVYGIHRVEPSVGGLGTNGAPEPQAYPVQPMIDDGYRGSNGAHRREKLYADDFVRPVDLPGSNLEPAPRRIQANSREVYGRAGDERDDISLIPPHTRHHDSRALYPNPLINAPQDTVYHEKPPTGHTDKLYPSVIRKTHDRAHRPVDYGDPGYMSDQPPRAYPTTGDRSVVVLD